MREVCALPHPPHRQHAPPPCTELHAASRIVPSVQRICMPSPAREWGSFLPCLGPAGAPCAAPAFSHPPTRLCQPAQHPFSPSAFSRRGHNDIHMGDEAGAADSTWELVPATGTAVVGTAVYIKARRGLAALLPLLGRRLQPAREKKRLAGLPSSSPPPPVPTLHLLLAFRPFTPAPHTSHPPRSPPPPCMQSVQRAAGGCTANIKPDPLQCSNDVPILEGGGGLFVVEQIPNMKKFTIRSLVSRCARLTLQRLHTPPPLRWPCRCHQLRAHAPPAALEHRVPGTHLPPQRPPLCSLQPRSDLPQCLTNYLGVEKVCNVGHELLKLVDIADRTTLTQWQFIPYAGRGGWVRGVALANGQCQPRPLLCFWLRISGLHPVCRASSDPLLQRLRGSAAALPAGCRQHALVSGQGVRAPGRPGISLPWRWQPALQTAPIQIWGPRAREPCPHCSSSSCDNAVCARYGGTNEAPTYRCQLPPVTPDAPIVSVTSSLAPNKDNSVAVNVEVKPLPGKHAAG